LDTQTDKLDAINPTRVGLALAAIYFVVAGVYIIVSTSLVGFWWDENSGLVMAEMVKGILFVIVTGTALFIGSRYLFQRIARQSTEIERQRVSITNLDRRASAGLLASAIGHDANNLLTSARMSLDLLGITRDPAKREESIEHLSRIVDELILLNRRLVIGGEAEQPGELKERDLFEECERVFHFLEADHPIRKLDLAMEHSGDTRAMVNRHLLFQCLINLLTNIPRHAGENARAQILVEEQDQLVVIHVDDNGVGIPPDIQSEVFEPFYSKHPEGSGLGLTSVRAIMRMHQGEVICDQSSLGGARFSLRFPKNLPAPNTAADTNPPDNERATAGSPA